MLTVEEKTMAGLFNKFVVAIVTALFAQSVLAGGHNQSREPAIAKDQELTAEIDAALNVYE